jgi:mitochondrial import receptor subunit TOM40
MQYHLGYVIPIRKGTTFVSHYKFDPENGSTTTLGMRQRYDAADITATLNSKLKLTTVLTLKSQFYGLKLCAEADYQREHYSFGYGISIGPQQ